MCENMPSRIKTEAQSLKKAALNKVTTLIISAFGLIAALAWNSAIQKAVSQFLNTSSELDGLVIYAVIVTLIAVIVTVYLSRLSAA